MLLLMEKGHPRISTDVGLPRAGHGDGSGECELPKSCEY